MSIFSTTKPGGSGSSLFPGGKTLYKPTSSTASGGGSSIFGDSQKQKKSNPFAPKMGGTSLFSSGGTKSPYASSATGSGGSTLFQTKTAGSSGSPFKSASTFTSKPTGGLFSTQTGAKESLFKSSMSSGKSSTYSFSQGASNPYAPKTQTQEPAGPQMVHSALTPAMIVDRIKSKEFQPDAMLKDLNPLLGELPEELTTKFKAYFDSTYKNFETLYKISEQAQILDKELDESISKTKEEGAELLSHLQSQDRMESKLEKAKGQIKKLEDFSSQTHLIVKGLTQVEEVPSQDFTEFWTQIFTNYRQNLRTSDAQLKTIERMSAANVMLDNNCELIKDELETAIESLSLEQKALLQLNLYFKSRIQGLGPMKSWVLQKQGKIPTQKKNLKGREFLIDLAEQIVAKKKEKEEEAQLPKQKNKDLPEVLRNIIALQSKEKQSMNNQEKDEYERLENFQRLLQHLGNQ